MSFKVYIFEYSHCIYDSGWHVESIHKTKHGAFKAMVKHRNECFNTDRELGIDPAEIGNMERWAIREFELNP
jgi:hypothetical protein